jgi:hypothetical protein
VAWNLAHDVKREVAQSLQEARKHSRTVENVALSFEPLAEGETLTDLEYVVEMSRKIHDRLTKMYNEVARDAFGPGSAKREDHNRAGSSGR